MVSWTSTYKWYILANDNTNLMKGKFKPSEDSLFKDGKGTRFQIKLKLGCPRDFKSGNIK